MAATDDTRDARPIKGAHAREYGGQEFESKVTFIIYMYITLLSSASE